MRRDDGFVFDSFYFVIKVGVARLAIIYSGGSRISKWGANPKGRATNLLFWPFSPKNCMKLKKKWTERRGYVSLVPLDPPLDYQLTKHLLVTG